MPCVGLGTEWSPEDGPFGWVFAEGRDWTVEVLAADGGVSTLPTVDGARFVFDDSLDYLFGRQMRAVDTGGRVIPCGANEWIEPGEEWADWP